MRNKSKKKRKRFNVGGEPLTNKIGDATKNAVDKDRKDEVEDPQDSGC